MFFIQSTGPATTHLAFTALTGRLQTAVKLQSKAQQPLSTDKLFSVILHGLSCRQYAAQQSPSQKYSLKDLLESCKSFNLSALPNGRNYLVLLLLNRSGINTG
jgi:hypothetical protein